ncbi:hypothetical protein A4G26_00160 [Mycobacterium kansasii]|nr:hypothetical protein A4G26_00160 [Mycobacterium kansasii]
MLEQRIGAMKQWDLAVRGQGYGIEWRHCGIVLGKEPRLVHTTNRVISHDLKRWLIGRRCAVPSDTTRRSIELTANR